VYSNAYSTRASRIRGLFDNIYVTSNKLTMTLELNDWQVFLLKELIYDEIDRISDYTQLSDEFKDILRQLRGNEEDDE